MTSSILIVDDSRPMLELLRMMLADAAIVVRECEDVAAALDDYTRLQPDWVLIDADMKDIDGIAVSQQILSADPNARVIILTDFDDSALRRRAFEGGASRYVVKEDLLSVLEILRP
jgi:PleD family two-component response regulator